MDNEEDFFAALDVVDHIIPYGKETDEILETLHAFDSNNDTKLDAEEIDEMLKNPEVKAFMEEMYGGEEPEAYYDETPYLEEIEEHFEPYEPETYEPEPETYEPEPGTDELLPGY